MTITDYGIDIVAIIVYIIVKIPGGSG
jgi:hypothetical protein